MSFGRIKAALMQETRTVFKYGVIGGVIGGACGGAVGATVQTADDFIDQCHLANDLGFAYNCTASINEEQCNIYCNTTANEALLRYDVDSKFRYKWPVVTGYSVAMGFAVGFVSGAALGVYEVIRKSNEAHELSLLDEQHSANMMRFSQLYQRVYGNSSESAVEQSNDVDIDINIEADQDIKSGVTLSR